ncbi:hypothetical protein [Burkholderia sp. S-53]|uniref:hypothetical protein n=1 Tax=Burkholderia sp. S-53 TaxID=2906514 RepID=UPI0021D02ED3|nr:hypothetical protein [Burkholderia sp. S-53]UXU91777.1 hypothetical protein LXM88_26810 [Burkholderia sp. S-53]
MKLVYEKRHILQAVTATFAVVAALGLSACGGGDDGGSGSAAASTDASVGGHLPGGAASSIRVEGQSQALSSSLATVSVMTPPVSWKADGSFPGGSLTLSTSGVDASQLKSQAPGAYTTLPLSRDLLSLSTGTVTDIAGNGDYAIGRWTAGSDSAGHSYNANQGQAWAVGAPVTVSLTDQTLLSCTLAAATRPTSTDGNTAPGSLAGATAVVTSQKDAFGNLNAHAALTLQYSIGADTNQTFIGSTQVGSISTSVTARSSLFTRFMGPNASMPYLVVSYGVHAPTAGGVNGLAVLSCK